MIILHVQDETWFKKHAQHLSTAKERKRGNSPQLLKQVEKYKEKRCCICGTGNDVELHHEDGNWRNCDINNVNWYCFMHHQQQDNIILKEKKFMPKNIARDEKFQQLFQKCVKENMSSGERNRYISNVSKKELGRKYSPLGVSRKVSRMKLLHHGNVQSGGHVTHLQDAVSLTQCLAYKKIVESLGFRFLGE